MSEANPYHKTLHEINFCSRICKLNAIFPFHFLTILIMPIDSFSHVSSPHLSHQVLLKIMEAQHYVEFYCLHMRKDPQTCQLQRVCEICKWTLWIIGVNVNRLSMTLGVSFYLPYSDSLSLQVHDVALKWVQASDYTLPLKRPLVALSNVHACP